MSKLVSIQDFSNEEKVELLDGLGYGSDGVFVLSLDGEQFLDKYTDEPIRLDNMFIYPGSVIILDNNPLSIDSFLEEYGDVL